MSDLCTLQVLDCGGNIIAIVEILIMQRNKGLGHLSLEGCCRGRD